MYLNPQGSKSRCNERDVKNVFSKFHLKLIIYTCMSEMSSTQVLLCTEYNMFSHIAVKHLIFNYPHISFLLVVLARYTYI